MRQAIQETELISFKIIGYFKGARIYKLEQPRQGVFSDSGGFIELVKGENYEHALRNLDGFEYIWVVFVFHLNSSWKPVTNPPNNDGNGKKGVFATRAPYRPNPIGMSCVRLEGIEGNKIFISGVDILSDSPILDIKPYIPEFDSFPEARTGWLENCRNKSYLLVYTPEAERRIQYLKENNADLTGVIMGQLGNNPLDTTRNKFKTENGVHLFRFRTWRIHFAIEETKVIILNILSGYQDYLELCGNDTPNDMEVHKKFNSMFQD